ncbi:MAG: hypothetical protein LBL39_04470 [Planctomycetaceae bacterium]|nr:hypothetical protein [Planctomycetaceae bacterium]
MKRVKRPKITVQQKITAHKPAQAYAYIRKKIQTEYAAAGLGDRLHLLTNAPLCRVPFCGF